MLYAVHGEVICINPQPNPYKAKAFDEQIMDVFKKKGESEYNILIVSNTPQVYRDIGLTGDVITVKRGTVNRHAKKLNHLTTADEWIILSNAIDKPIGYFREEQNLTKYHFYFDIFKSKGRLMIVLEERSIGRRKNAEIIITAFYKNDYERLLDEGRIKEINQSSVQWHKTHTDLPSSTGSD